MLDWFHIGMRFEQLLLSIRGLQGADVYTRDRLQNNVVAAKWLLWNGRKERCLEGLEALRRETGWVGAHNRWAGSSATCAAAPPSSSTTRDDGP